MPIGLSDPMAAATKAWFSTLAPKIWEVERIAMSSPAHPPTSGTEAPVTS